MTKQRKKYPKYVPGRLTISWGCEDKHSKPDVVYCGINSDARMLHSMFSGFGIEDFANNEHGYRGYLKELEARGYDLSTLKFCIEKKK